MGIFGKSTTVDPKDQVKQWTSTIRKEGYKLDRQIRGIEREEAKVKQSLKEAAKKGNKDVCIILAKEVIRSRKTINKIITSKTHLNSIQMQMKNQLSVLRMAGSLQKSTEVMQTMHSLIKVPEVAATMRDLSKEMMKAGIIEEMLDDTMESVMDDPEDMEEEAQSEIDKVLWEITAGALGQAPMAVTETPGGSVQQQIITESIEEDDDLEDMKSRLEALKS
ncbi:charged multivesicular body protein 3 [Daktulosphaira vitifoliae]|uniref:charged multivesicular body protein 3 n=1 Tax=Daktulosphaira vitifoliae TaxID=58002 RepID=UPI0021AA2E25|nr:charged multivesicular body protein 3 [Daktulosphaira vitifoliae]